MKNPGDPKSSANFHAVVGRILSEPNFAESLLANPERAANTLRGMGIEPTPEVMATWSRLDPAALRRLAATFGRNLLS